MNPASHDSARDRQLEAILHTYLQAVAGLLKRGLKQLRTALHDGSKP